jgi:hypothetical protein
VPSPGDVLAPGDATVESFGSSASSCIVTPGHIDNDTPYALVIVTVDALHATKRKLAVAGKEESVPAIRANLAVD